MLTSFSDTSVVSTSKQGVTSHKNFIIDNSVKTAYHTQNEFISNNTTVRSKLAHNENIFI